MTRVILVLLWSVLFCAVLPVKAESLDISNSEISRPSLSLNPVPEEILPARRSIWTIQYGQSKGTAFAVGPNTVVTNFHVILPIILLANEVGNNVFLYRDDSPMLSLKRLISISPRGDLALLEIEGRVSEWLNMEESSPSLEEPLYVVKDESQISSTGDMHCAEYYCFFPSNFFIKRGTSGSPVLSAQGKVAGVTFMSSVNILYMVKWDFLKDFITGQKGFFCNDLSAMDCIVLSLEVPFYNENYWGQYLVSEIMQTRGDLFARLGHLPGARMFYNKAFGFLSLSAKAGFSVAQNALGATYGEGKLVPKNEQEAVYWYEQAARQGLSSAQFNFAEFLYRGMGGHVQNPEEAVLWYRRAAIQGLSSAQWKLAALLQAGVGVPQDIASALYWYKEAANQGNEEAQLALMDLYYRGVEGIEQDKNESVRWALMAALQGNRFAQYYLGFVYEKDEEGENLIEAVYWYREAAIQGHEEAQMALMDLYYLGGKGLKQDRKEAFKWGLLAAQQGHLVAQHHLGIMYEKGRGVNQDFKEALRWYKQAADQGFPASQYNIALMAEEGRGMEQDLVFAKNYYTKAADQGYSQAQSRLTALIEKEGI